VDYAEVVRRIASGDREISTRTDDPDDVCPVCGGSGWELIDEEREIGDHIETIKAARRCTGCNGGHARKVADAKVAADIAEDRDLSSFNWDLYDEDLTKERRIVEKYVENLPEFEREGFGLFITSKTRGSGKTYLASAIGGELINRYALTVRFVSVSDLLEISRQKRDDGGDPLEDLISCRVLILDDLGQKLTGRDWLADVLFRIIDKRYRTKRTVVVTSNDPVTELDLDDRIVDRLYRMTFTVRLPETCIRAREANTRRREIMAKLGIS